MNQLKPRQIKTQDAPSSPFYSQGIVIPSGATEVLTSGQVAFDPETKQLVSGGIKKQTERVLKNLDAILQEGGLERGIKGTIVSVQVVLSDKADFVEFNEVYSKWIGVQHPLPTRFSSIVEIPVPGALVEISCRAFIANEE